ncbi:FAST kinase domain-containing protein 5, mitochondrial-like isoform X1 [Ambystoma mexicanum]|uniref:FAST kinase domain-containing protein 5, mitochondrial-like isoform X1 n=1 Tax=Ambystoma mexicanum TaxID=8296 RepID=UPI0037E8C6FA
MATVICRRFPGRACRAATFSVATRCTKKQVPEERCEHSDRDHEQNCSKHKVNSTVMLHSLEYRVLYNPSAYAGTKKHSYCLSEDSEDDFVENPYSSTSGKQIQNTYSITCSRSLSSTRNTLLELAFSKPVHCDSSLIQTVHPGKNQELEQSDVESFNTKEDPRAFQKQRADYGSLCSDCFEAQTFTTMEEGEHILKNVSILKSSLSPETLAFYFGKLSCLPVDQLPLVRVDTRFAMLCRYSVDGVRSFSISEIITVLKAFVSLGIPPTHSMLNVYEAELCRRVWEMKIVQLLLVADVWRCLGRIVPRYLDLLFSYFNLHWKDLSLTQLVQLVYIIGEGRKAPQDLMEKLESLVLKYIDSMNLEETGAICLGFFKSHSGLSEHVMQKIGDKVSISMEEISNYALVNVLKMFRFTHVDHVQFLKRLGQIVPQRIPTIGTQGVMHISLACAALHYLDEGILNAVAETIPSRVVYCRSKDLAKFLWSFGALNYEPPNARLFYSSLTNQMRNMRDEFEKFPEHLLTCLLALAFAHQFPFDLIDFALSDKFVKLATQGSRFELKKDLFTLDGSVGIECPKYTGNRMKPQLQEEVSEMLWDFASKELCTKVEVVEAAALLGAMLGGPQYVKNHMILPHTRSNDLEIHLNINGQALPFNKGESTVSMHEQKIKAVGVYLTDNLMSQLLNGKRDACVHVSNNEHLPKLEDVEVKENATCPTPHSLNNVSTFTDGVPLTDGLLTILTESSSPAEKPVALPDAQPEILKLAIQVSNRNHYAYASKHLLGLHSLKRRQLRRLGYVVIELPFWEWGPLLRRTRSEKLAYLHHKVFGSFD